MLDNILLEIANLKWFALIYVLILAIIIGVLYLTTRRFENNLFRIKSYAAIFAFDTKQLIALALMISRFVFIVCSTIFSQRVNVIYLGIIIVITILIVVLLKDYRSLFISLLNYVAIYTIVYLESSLFIFYHEVEKYWLILAMSILLGVFSVLYSLYHLVSTYNRMIEKPQGN